MDMSPYMMPEPVVSGRMQSACLVYSTKVLGSGIAVKGDICRYTLGHL